MCGKFMKNTMKTSFSFYLLQRLAKIVLKHCNRAKDVPVLPSRIVKGENQLVEFYFFSRVKLSTWPS